VLKHLEILAHGSKRLPAFETRPAICKNTYFHAHTTFSCKCSAGHPAHANITLELPFALQPLNKIFCSSRIPPVSETTLGHTSQIGGEGMDRKIDTADAMLLSVKNKIRSKRSTSAKRVKQQLYLTMSTCSKFINAYRQLTLRNDCNVIA
jgi:hypothetical protein